jgi:hypothetical protein
MVAFGINNKAGSPDVNIDVSADDDEGPFISLRIEEQTDQAREIADILIDTEADADELLEMVTKAVERFKELKSR